MSSAVVVVDTNVVSYILKRDSRGQPYRYILQNKEPVISFMTIAELDSWVQRQGWGPRRVEHLEAYISNFNIRWCNRNLCKLWAFVTNMGRRSGRPIEHADAWIAATALELACPLVTHNARDYAAIEGLQVLLAEG